ncbi:UNVERIFIED_CONTAM: hypothetical protein PYX00_002542 [Menopon gallinae]|uniref:Uncharacterized protein n=1 Tax=Menopon gallinae TaxID=328185 RepID=A0AAW2IGY6_9NEOP
MELCDSGQNFSIAKLSMEVLTRNKDSNINNLYSYTIDGHLHNSETAYHMPSPTLFFNNLSKQNRKSEMSLTIPNNMKKKFENFTKYITSKENNYMKYTMDQWNSGYSEFFTSPKPYLYDSNSTASYLIGGFVGSKSQMNNEKHKLSYDLGEVILKIQDIKCKYEEKKTDVPKSQRKQKTFKDANFSYEHQYNIVLVNNTSDKLKNNFKDSRNLANEGFYFASHNIKVDLESVKNKRTCNFQPFLNNEIKADEKHESATVKVTNEICHKKLEDNYETFKDEGTICGSENKDFITAKDTTVSKCDELLEGDQHRSDTTSVHCFTPYERRRQSSECSIESTDSESFIVFDDRCCESSYDEPQNENDKPDFCLDEDDCGNLFEDDEDSCWIRSGDECDTHSEDNEIAEANARWSEIYKNAGEEVDDSKRKVTS